MTPQAGLFADPAQASAEFAKAPLAARMRPPTLVTASVADLRKVVEVARRTPHERTIMFIDEIHRFKDRGSYSVEPRQWVRSERFAPA